jgi:predicted MFS family arabinose efflux permease
MARAVGVLITLATMGFLMVTNEIMPFGLINLMAADLGRSQSQIGLLVTGFAVVVLLASVPLALATKRIPRRQLLTITMIMWSVGALIAATSSDYTMLLVSRVLTALGQSMYWAVVTATVAGLFAPEVRGKIVSRLLLGPATANVLGLPTATWLGQQFSWQTPFYVVAGIGAVIAVAIAILVPSYTPDAGAASRGSAPHKSRYIALMGVTFLSVVGLMVVYTYITPFLTEVSGFAESTMPLLLISSGLAGMLAMWIVGRYLDRYPRGALATGLGIVFVTWGGMILFGTIKPVAAALFIAVGLGFSTLIASLVNRVMQLSPGSTDLGIAIYSSFYNAGIACGSLLGAGILAYYSPSLLPVAGLISISLALVLLGAVNKIVAPRTRR